MKPLNSVAGPLCFIFILLCLTGCNKKDNLSPSGIKDEEFPDNPTSFIFHQSINAESDRERLGLNLQWADFEPTGLYAPPGPGSRLLINVKNLSGKSLPTLIIGTYYRYNAKLFPDEIRLTAGQNTVEISGPGGMLYIRYTSENPDTNDRVKIDFLGGALRAPLFTNGTTAKHWQWQLEKYKNVPDVTLISDYALQVYSLSSAILWKDQNIPAVLKNVDKIIGIENDISGLVNDNSSIHSITKHKVLMTQTDIPNSYMFASNYITAYKSPTHYRAFSNSIVEGNDEGWGPWHELGHMHQQSAWTWQEVGEVTVNIYSLAVERTLGIKPSRLTESGSWTKMVVFTNSTASSKNFNDDNQIDVFTRLCLFDQLRLAFGDTFFKELHRQTRIENPDLKTREEKMEYFMKKASLISGKNLTDFFRKWGFVGVNNGYAAIKSLNLPAPDSDLTLLRE
ncbi:M60 family metallopeptidase [Arsenicibacter rosenii]|uniref:Peptidase M60 domain-containing protein n=1 Tax=Arsenicibacter rosenii TaxID=1750698 RepID=A0A1S2VLB3_9BACT|nr:M60 family metallopeptidase [Arsenicibacter rosenii]OIN59567.1 hypothetical protein BLX24_06745 [Arsenicibacter rosenii]